MGEGGFASARDGAVEVDSNTGSAEDLQQELASEVAVVESDGRRSSKPAAATLTVDDDDAGEAPAAAAAAGAEGRSAAAVPAKDRRRSLQARINEITGEKYTTARERDAAVKERDALRAELETLKAEKAAPAGEGRQAAAAPAAADAGAAAGAAMAKVGGVDLAAEKFPKYAEWLQGGNDGELEDWVDARDAWKEARASKVAAETSERNEHSARFTKTAATFNDRMAPVLKADPKFYDRIDPRLTETPAMSALPKGRKPTLGNFLVEQVIHSKYPKDLMEYLSEAEVIQRLETLQPGDILRDIARFEVSLGGAAAHDAGPAARTTDDDDDEEESSSAAAAAAISTSRAHPPAKPVRGSSHEHVSPDQEPGEDASDDDWYRWQKKQDAKAARA